MAASHMSHDEVRISAVTHHGTITNASHSASSLTSSENCSITAGAVTMAPYT